MSEAEEPRPEDLLLDDEWDDADDPYGDEFRDCHWCGGDGWVECDDPIQCTKEHFGGDYQLCSCASCGGSGRAEDMTIW